MAPNQAAVGVANRSSRCFTSPPSPKATEDNLPSLRERRLVGPGRVERPTSRLSGVRSNHLSYEPVTETEFTKSGIRRSKRARSKRGGMPKQSEARYRTSQSDF